MIHCQVKKLLKGPQGPLNLLFNNDLSEGEIIGLYGPSGSGKTSILRMIAGLMKPDEGLITFQKETWFNQKQKINKAIQKRNVGFIFQDYALFPHLNVLQNIAYGLSNNENQNRVHELIDLTGLSKLINHYPATLSGGQQQRVALCRALVPNPKLILLDEPLSALDGSTRRNLQMGFKQLHREFGFTAIMVSHDISELLRVCDRLINIETGKIVSDQSIQEYATHSENSKISTLAEVIQINRNDDQNSIIVLLGNESHILPISKENIKSIEIGSMIPFHFTPDISS